MQQSDQPATTDAVPVKSVDPKPPDLRNLADAGWLQGLRRYLLMRPVLFGVLVVLLILHFASPEHLDISTLAIAAGMYLLVVGSGGLEAARLSSAGGDQRRQERLAEDALRRAGRLQSHLEPCSATDDVVNRILAGSHDPRHMVIQAGNEVEEALRAVYRHYSEAERMAGTSNGTDLPLTFLVQELIWRGLLAPDISDTAEPVLALREMAQDPRTPIAPTIANDAARATQAIILRVQSLGIEIHPRRTPLAWLRNDATHSSDGGAKPPFLPQMDALHDSDEREEEATVVEEIDLADDEHIIDGDRMTAPLPVPIPEPTPLDPIQAEPTHTEPEAAESAPVETAHPDAPHTDSARQERMRHEQARRDMRARSSGPGPRGTRR